MKQLPLEFETRMKSLLGDGYDDFVSSLNAPPVKAFRVNKSKIELNVGPKMLKNDESCYWFFSKEKSWTNWDNGFAFGHYLTANIYMDNGDDLEVVFGTLPLEIGKYYYFNDMTNSFDIPKMESGN